MKGRNTILKTYKPKRKRSGIHSKKRTSNHKGGKNYVKKYKGQGK
jgi:hypothetical protein